MYSRRTFNKQPNANNQTLLLELGANTYRLVLGNNLYRESGNRLDQFTRKYDKELHLLIHKAVEEFLDPKDEEVRSYVLRTLNASFFVEASNLNEETLKALEKITGASNPIFNVFIDTNLLISILGLNTAAEEIVGSLMNLIKQLSGRITIKLYVLKNTCDEFNRVITAKSLSLKGLHLPGNLSAVALESNLDAIDLKYVEEYKRRGELDAIQYFDPYLKNLITIIRSKGLELYNDNLDGYTTNQNVINDIHEEEEYERKRYKTKAKDYDRLEHDIILWHFAKDRRSIKLDSPLGAKFWVAEERARIAQELGEKDQALANAVSNNEALTSRVDALEKHLSDREMEEIKAKQRRGFLLKWVMVPASTAALLLLIISVLLLKLNLPAFYTVITISLLFIILTVGLVKLIESKGNRYAVVAETAVFQLFKHLARLVKWGLIVVGAIWGFASSIYSDEIKDAINVAIKVFRG